MVTVEPLLVIFNVGNVSALPAQIAAGAVMSAIVATSLTVIVALPESVAGQPFPSLTSSKVYVVVAVGDTDIVVEGPET